MALQVTTDISVGGNQAIGGAGIDLALLDEIMNEAREDDVPQR
jgi:molecular chaperone DnaK (HSP70)